MVRQTSLQAYREEKPHIGRKQLQILGMIRLFPDRTDREYTKLLGYGDPNKIRPRRKELLDMGKIRESGKRRCTVSSKTALTWRVTE